jgi:hypothetical protein
MIALLWFASRCLAPAKGADVLQLLPRPMPVADA